MLPVFYNYPIAFFIVRYLKMHMQEVWFSPSQPRVTDVWFPVSPVWEKKNESKIQIKGGFNASLAVLKSSFCFRPFYA